MAEITQSGSNLWHIDLPFQGQNGVIGAYVLSGKNAAGVTELALIDPGPETTAQALLHALHEGGWRPADVTHILITHIHLDHSGGVGTLLQAMPQARVLVHPLGAPHLREPARLIQSAARIYGDQMQNLWGKIESVPAAQIDIVQDETIIDVAGQQLRAYYTPGHASHHIVFHNQRNGALFAGDVAGVRLREVAYVRPPTPPPDLDLEAWQKSISRIKSLRPSILYLAHFGGYTEIDPLLDELQQRLMQWSEYVLQALHEHKENATIVAELQARVEPELQQKTHGNPDISQRYALTTSYQMTADGYIRYWKKHHPERLS